MKQGPLNIFISYSSIDSDYKDEFKKHLKSLEVEGIIKIWDGDLIKIGSEWDNKIKQNIKTADIIIILLSPDSVVSEYINQVELKLAVKSRKRIFPIVIRPCNWLGLSISRYQCLPKNGKPISSFDDRDQIYSSIVSEIREVITSDEITTTDSSKLHSIVDLKRVGTILHAFKMLLNQVMELMEQIPLKKEVRGEDKALFLDSQPYEDKVFGLSLEFITIRNRLLDELEMLDKDRLEEIESHLEDIFTYVNLNRVGYNVPKKDWKRIFRIEVLVQFNQILNKSLKE